MGGQAAVYRFREALHDGSAMANWNAPVTNTPAPVQMMLAQPAAQKAAVNYQQTIHAAPDVDPVVIGTVAANAANFQLRGLQ